MWFKTASKFLIDIGFKQSVVDPCIFFKDDIVICLYFDDMLIMTDHTDNLVQLEKDLVGTFGGKMKHSVDGKIEFLGMTFCFQDGGVSIGMKAKLDEVLEYATCKKKAPTHVGNNLFTVDPNSVSLEKDQKELFHSLVAKLNYIAKRIRPDILTAVNFLTTRVHQPTKEDFNKLLRVLSYLRETRELQLNLKIGERFQVVAHVDAAYGVHDDMKSQTGMPVGIGDAIAIDTRSTKQKIVSKSSTKAELIAASDSAGDLISIYELVKEFGFECLATLYQDNQATIALLRNGKKASGRSKNIKIHFFLLTERINEGDFNVVFKPTEEMIADGLTKPLQGGQFVRFRNAILGYKPVLSKEHAGVQGSSTTVQ